MIYLVDYENVNLYGMTGIEKLTAQDSVIVFLGNTIGAIPFEWHIRISDAPAKVKYIKCGKVCKNYLDFQLATYCGYLMAGLESGKVFIISKDKGFDSVVDFWTDNKEHVKISRVETIDESLGIVPEAAKQEKEEKAESQEHPEKPQRPRRSPQRGRGRRSYGNRQNNNADKAGETVQQAENQADVADVQGEHTEPVGDRTQEVKADADSDRTPQEGKAASQAAEAAEDAVQTGASAAQGQPEKPEKAEDKQDAPVKPDVQAAETEVKVQEMKAEQKKEKEAVTETETVAAVKSEQPARKGKLSEGIKKRIRLKVKDEELKGGSYKTIYNIFMNESAKNRFNTALVKAFQQEKGNRIYKKLLPEFEEHLKEQ